MRGPGDLSKVHLPVGGERFRPALEDLIEMLIRDCGIDGAPGWEGAVEKGRMRWRIRQLRASVRDQQAEAVDVLRTLGWKVSRAEALPDSHDAPYTHW